MIVCYFGAYNRDYSRNSILIKVLRQNGVVVLECHDASPLPLRLWRLFWKHWKIRAQYDAMIVGFAGQGMTLFAKLITRKPVVLDAFYSLYNTIAEDRQFAAPRSLRARWARFLDIVSARIADKVLLDTQAHIEYYVKTFGLPREKFARILLGADNDIFKPTTNNQQPTTHDRFIVGFQGTYVPLQGTEYIVRAAKLLEDNEKIEFVMLGEGQAFKATKALAEKIGAQNITFAGYRVPLEKVPQWIEKSDICLGIFGNTPKVPLVIPNKVYDCVAMKKAVITADTPAIRELFDESQLCLVPPANPEAIAKAIRTLKANPARRASLAEKGFARYREKVTPSLIGKALLGILEKL